jgi:hypothetical protein
MLVLVEVERYAYGVEGPREAWARPKRARLVVYGRDLYGGITAYAPAGRHVLAGQHRGQHDDRR